MTDHKLARKLRMATMGAASTLLLAPLANAQSEETDNAKVTVESAEPQVTVQEAEPEVTVGDSDPNVTVTDEQEDAEVVVEQPEPEVNVNMPEPGVEVIEAESAEDGEVSQATVDAQDTDTQEEQQPEAQAEQQSDAQAEQQAETQAEQQAQAQTQAEQEQPEPPEQSPLDRMRVAQLEGETVYSTDNEELGSIENVVMANDGSNAGVVISMGGLWGFFESQVLIPFSELELTGDQLVWQTNKTTDEMEDSGYEEENYTDVSPVEYEQVNDLRNSQ